MTIMSSPFSSSILLAYPLGLLPLLFPSVCTLIGPFGRARRQLLSVAAELAHPTEASPSPTIATLASWQGSHPQPMTTEPTLPKGAAPAPAPDDDRGHLSWLGGSTPMSFPWGEIRPPHTLGPQVWQVWDEAGKCYYFYLHPTQFLCESRFSGASPWSCFQNTRLAQNNFKHSLNEVITAKLLSLSKKKCRYEIHDSQTFKFN